MHKVTNEAFEAALANPDNRRVIGYLCKKYRNLANNDELWQHGCVGLFKCMKRHGETTPKRLYWYIRKECLKGIAIRRDFPLPSHLSASLDIDDPVEVKDCMDMMSADSRNILLAYFFMGMTLAEIGREKGHTRVAAFYLLKRAKDEFRRLYQPR
jgi:DNA-directed RNA polymerase specialized sigma subunit